MRAKLTSWLAAAAACLALAGCLAPMADPGPNPGRLNLALKAGVSDAQVQKAVREDPLQPIGRAASSSVLGPNWHLEALLIDAQGQTQRLPMAPGGAFGPPAGPNLDQKVGFLLPPGAQTVRLTLWAEVTHAWQERVGPDVPVLNSQGQTVYYDPPNWRQRSSVIQVQQWRQEFKLDLAPGQARELIWP